MRSQLNKPAEFLRPVRVSIILAALLVSACGGGGDSGPQISMTLSTHQVTQSATTDDAAPTATIDIFLSAAPPHQVYVGYQTGYNAISSVSAVGHSASSATVTISFKAPSQLGAGTYTDTLALAVCLDQQCSQQVGNSPQNVDVQYTVTAAGNGPPSPTLSSLNPSSASAGGPGFTLMVTGDHFVNGSAVQWNGSSRATNFLSATQLSAQIDAADIATPGTYSVTVANPAGSGGTSNAATFTVGTVPLSITSVSPQAVTAGGSAFTLTVLGAGFAQGAEVQWNGAPRATAYVSSTELTAQLGAADIASIGTAAVTVVNSAGGASSNVEGVAIDAPSIDAVAYQINAAHTGAVNFKSVSLPAPHKWSVDLGGLPSYALIAQGKVFVTVNISNSTQLIALDQATGATAWGPVVIASAANAAYDAGTVFVSNYDGLVQAFDAANGQQKWSAKLPGQFFFSSAPVATNGFVYSIGSESGSTIYAVDEQTGALIWTQGLFAGGDGSVAVTVDGVYTSQPFFTGDYRPATGEAIWTNASGGDGGGGATPVAAGGVLYSPDGFGTYNGDRFNAELGQLLGSYVSDNPPAFGSQTGYFLQSGTLRGVTLASNSVAWSFAGDGNLVTAPIAVNQYVFVGSSTGTLYALDGATGAQVWSTTLGAAIPQGAGWGAGIPYSGLSAGDGLLIVPAGNTLNAFTLSTNP